MTRTNKGFVIIELVIGLVVATMLLGGVLIGRELINASRLNKIISEKEGYTRIVVTFQQKYRELPGDMKNAQRLWPTCTNNVPYSMPCNGNGNGRVEFAVSAGWACYAVGGCRMWWIEDYGDESLRAWQHIALSGILPDSYTGLPVVSQYPSGFHIGRNLPISAASQNSGYLIESTDGKNFLSLKSTEEQSDFFQGAVLSTEDANSIDLKVDDGKPTTGAVRANTGNEPGTGSCRDPLNMLEYNFNNNEISCYIQFQIPTL